MQRISFAPVLSATRSRDSCWITYLLLTIPGPPDFRPDGLGLSRKDLLGLLEDLDEPPALRGRQRSGLHQQDAVAHARRVLLVVRLHLGGGAHDLGVTRVLLAVFQRNHDRLVHL